MIDPFLQSVFVQPQEVLGKKLKPLSAFHLAALLIIESPFLEDVGEVGVGELATAVFICTLDFKTGPSQLFPEPNYAKIRRWAVWNKFDFPLEQAIFEQHLMDYLNIPEIWGPDDNGPVQLSAVPSPVQVVVTVLENMHGITEAEAWDMPYSRLVGYKMVIAENMGMEIMTSKIRSVLDLTDVAN